jgi:DNA-binding Lrp family transcriptional regulator
VKLISFYKQLDDIDFHIISLLQEDPNLTYNEIARQLKRSQPAIGARVKKLTELGLLGTQIGADVKIASELNLVRVEMSTTRPDDVIEMGMHCPFVANVFKMMGDNNIGLYCIASNLKQIDFVLDRHFRNKPYVKSLSYCRITEVGKKFILPIDLNADSLALKSAESPCSDDPLCREARMVAGARTPEELNLV